MVLRIYSSTASRKAKVFLFFKIERFLHFKILGATINSISKKEKSKTRPQALNTVELLRVCSAKLGIGPAQAMSVAERLYTQGEYLSREF